MTPITKDNLTSFMDYYHWFHDSYITDVKYEFKNDQIELYFNIYWSGDPTLKDDGTYECIGRFSIFARFLFAL
ncbi:MAG: hypothetical protein HFH08_05245, partial [Bacilli bacterium]|nr:hypothetical protein [Bacilli bacterium]